MWALARSWSVGIRYRRRRISAAGRLTRQANIETAAIQPGPRSGPIDANRRRFQLWAGKIESNAACRGQRFDHGQARPFGSKDGISRAFGLRDEPTEPGLDSPYGDDDFTLVGCSTLSRILSSTRRHSGR